MATENDSSSSSNTKPRAIDMIDVANSLDELKILANLIMDKVETNWPERHAQMFSASALIDCRNHDANQINYLAGRIVGVVQSLEGVR